jgi:prepilin-type N-terminal cleavage/methylation domain-containing protein/prepilin-type processing-associated H-X9-DG protein
MMTFKQRCAFTLIELLVVIAIIALLLSVILPALRKSKQIAQSVVCRNSLKQMGVGFHSYYMQYNNKALISTGGQDFWFLQISPFMGDDFYQPGSNLDPELTLSGTMKIVKCPATLSPTREWDPSGGLGQNSPGTARNQYRYHVIRVEGSYAINRWTGGWVSSVFDPSTAVGRENLRKSYRDKAPASATIPMVSDAIWVDSMPLNSDEDPPEDLSTGRDSGLGRFTTNRHGLTTNILYGDGHVESIRLAQLWAQRWHKEFQPRDVEVQAK